MSLSLGSNLFSLRAQRALSNATSRVSDSLLRLSSGARINRASDDAASLSIAERLKANRLIYGAAIRNASDGLSALSIMDGALGEQRAILMRLYELAEQSANGSYSDAQRASLSNEYKALVGEFGRIGNATTFNGLKLLRGLRSDGLSRMNLQVGVDGSSSSNLMLSGVDTGNLSGSVKLGPGALTLFADSGTFEELYEHYGAEPIRVAATSSDGQMRDIYLYPNQQATGGGNVRLNYRVYQKVSDTGGVGAQSGAGAAGEVLSAEDDLVYAGGFSAVISQATGRVESYSTPVFTLSFDGGTRSGSYVPDFSGLVFVGAIFPTDGEVSSLEASGIEYAGGAQRALETLSVRLAELSSYAGAIGAVSARLETALNVLRAARENETAAEARIRDSDVAQESAKLTAATILQQVSTAVLSQANQAPDLVLSLLQQAGTDIRR